MAQAILRDRQLQADLTECGQCPARDPLVHPVQLSRDNIGHHAVNKRYGQFPQVNDLLGPSVSARIQQGLSEMNHGFPACRLSSRPPRCCPSC
jgi:hypothetical protein